MKILIVGSGGREHAILNQIQNDHPDYKIYVAPGNAGMAETAECVDLAATDISKLVTFAKNHSIDLTIVGPEQPLTDGIVDAFAKENLKCFGPSQRASLIEGSKVYTKEFCSRHHIPTAPFMVFHKAEHAKAYVQETPHYPVVIKADGLAAGKGVIIAKNQSEANQAIDDFLTHKKFGEAGSKIVIEDFLPGEEASFFILTDGENFIDFPIAQDHKRVFDNDEGPNTGGMGAYAPSPVVTKEIKQKIIDRIVYPTLIGLKEENRKFIGFLYIGLMIDSKNNPHVIEYNCRLGDPEAQVILPLLKTDLLKLIDQTLEKNLKNKKAEFKNEAAVTVVLASEGYPKTYEKGYIISGLDKKFPDNIKIFHSGTKKTDKAFVTNGGRVLAITAINKTLKQAIENAYAAIANVEWHGMHFRKDIAKKAL